MKSLKTKIVVMIILSTLTISTIVGVVLMNNSYDAYELEAVDKLQHLTYLFASEFNQELNLVEHLADEAELVVSALFDFDALNKEVFYMDNFKETIDPVIKRIAEKGASTQSAYVFFLPSLDGRAHDVWYADLDYVGQVTRQDEFEASYYDAFIPGREWFFVPTQTGRPYWTAPYEGNANYDDHIIYISYTKPIFVNHQIIGVAGADYHFNLLKEDISNISLYETGYAFLINENGDILVHDTLEDMDNLDVYREGEYKWLNDKMLTQDSDTVFYEWIDGEKKLMSFKRLSNGWTFGVSVKVEEVFVWYAELKVFLIVLTLMLLLSLSILAYRMGLYITKDLSALKDHVQVIGAGDYNHGLTADLLKRKDETGVLANSIEQMRLKQKELFQEINHANDVLESKITQRTAALEDKTRALLGSLEANEKQNQALSALNNELEMSIETIQDAQKQLIETEKLASLGFLVSKLSHEFNTPLGSLTTLSTYLIKEKSDASDLYVQKKLRARDLDHYFSSFDGATALVLKNIQQLETLVKRFKEMDPDTLVGHYSVVNMQEYFAVVLDSMSYVREDVEVVLVCPAELNVYIDQGKLGQVLIHLIENAYVHAFDLGQGGQVKVAMALVDSYLNIRVTDDGRGISKESIKHIFDPFYSEHLSKDSNGLGLSIVYNIVTKIFKGRVDCESDLLTGTSFEINFPVDRPEKT